MAIFGLLVCMYTSFKVSGATNFNNNQNQVMLESKEGEKIPISREAAELSGTLKNVISDIPGDEEIPVPRISAEILQKIISILEEVKNLKKRPDGGYITQQVQEIVRNGLIQTTKEFEMVETALRMGVAQEIFPEGLFTSKEELIELLNAADFLDIQLLINASAKLLVDLDKERVKTIVTNEEGGLIPLHLHIYLKKHLKLEEKGVRKELSIMDLIAQYYGTPKFFKVFIKEILSNNTLDLSGPKVASLANDKRLTSLYGINFLATTIKRLSTITKIDLFINRILGKGSDPDFPTEPFELFGNVETINLDFNNFDSLSKDFFKGLDKLKKISIRKNPLSEETKSYIQGLLFNKKVKIDF